jgi:hypothetical protein
MVRFPWDFPEEDDWVESIVAWLERGPRREPECEPVWLGTQKAAQFLGVSVDALGRMRRDGTGPAFAFRGRRIEYDRHVLARFQRARDSMLNRITSAEHARALMTTTLAAAERYRDQTQRMLHEALTNTRSVDGP